MNENPMNPGSGANNGQQGFTAPQGGNEQFSGFTAPQGGNEQFSGFTTPQGGNGQFSGFTAPQGGNEQFSGFTAPQGGNEQFSGFTSPQNNGGQIGNTAAQGFAPENESGIREITGGFSNQTGTSPVKNESARKPGKKPKKKKEKHPVRRIIIAVIILLIIAAIALTPFIFIKIGDSKLASEDFAGAHSMYKLSFGLYGSKNRITAAKTADDILQGGDIKSSIKAALEKGLKVQLHYDLNGGEFINANRQKDVLLEDKAQFADLYNATMQNYDFLGWKLVNVSYKPDFDDTVIELSLKAEFTPTVYQITYASLYSDEQNNPTEYTYETESITLKNPSRVGYTFVAWEGSDINGEAPTVVISHGSSGDRAYIAKWSPNTYSVTLDPGEYGNGKKVVSVTYDAAYEFPMLTKRGYTFKGWSDGSNVYSYTGSWTVANDITLTPSFELDNYTLAFELDGGSMANVGKETYTVHDAAFDIPNPTRHGYTFLGWTYEGQSTAKKDVTIPTNSVGNLNFKANWTGNRHTIKLNLNGGKAYSSTVDVVYGSNYSIPTPTRTGYTFDGWFNGSTQYTSGTWELDSDLTLNAKWTANQYKISFNSSGGGSFNAQTVTFGTYVSLPTPSKSGYDFDGWYDGSTKVTSGTWSVAKNVTLVAKWTNKSSTLTLNANGGPGVPSSITVRRGEYYSLPTPRRTGYNFLGWYNGSSYFSSSGYYNLTSNVSLTAKWEAKGVKITLNANGGTVSPGSILVKYGASYTLPTPPKNGATFAGWYYGNTRYDTSGVSNFASEITLTAKWENQKAYTIKLDAMGGTVSQTFYSYNVGDYYSLPTPYRSGYKFYGWADFDTREIIPSSGRFNFGRNLNLMALWVYIG